MDETADRKSVRMVKERSWYTAARRTIEYTK